MTHPIGRRAKFLMLSGYATEMRPTYVDIAKKLKEKGCDVVFALDSGHTDYTCSHHPMDGTVYHFTEFFRKNYNVPLANTSYLNHNLWGLMYSDLERSNVFNINTKRPKGFFRKVIVNLLNFFDEIIAKEDIDAVIYEIVTDSFSYAAHLSALMNKKAYFGLTGSRLPNRFEVQTTLLGNADQIYDTFNDLNEGKLSAPEDIKKLSSIYMDNFLQTVPDYMKNNPLDARVSLLSKYLNLEKLRLFGHQVQYILKENEGIYYNLYDNPIKFSLSKVIRNFKRKMRLNIVNRYYDKVEGSDSYFLYPLHYHPEASTSVLAKEYTDELNVIENISKNLPFGKLLYVKDHMSAAGYSTMAFYKKVSSLPNVKLLHYSENTKELIQGSEAVITLTSTVGYEALLLHKKVFLFGEVFYSRHPNCQKIASWSDLFELLNNTEIDIDTAVINSNFLHAYFMNTIEGELLYSDPPNTKMTASFVDYILNIFPLCQDNCHPTDVERSDPRKLDSAISAASGQAASLTADSW